ncbi:uncharacterized protein LOC107646401 [Arachis ipaensis]|uniref:uncharacterized protein LOC107646401 n=1 Tax=Arachis ipaensis TaxID=130454 RepID=UPI0007AFD5F2|nr:uncharacterized protein LOC107646401 [Arachis ipaensis]
MNFIKKCWEEIGMEFTAAVMGFFQSAKLPTNANITWVTLAPKFFGAKEIKDFRPISMVGCVYKVISKVLMRRMRSVMPGLVGETQSAFVKGRKIHDGALIACETVHWLKSRRKQAAIIKMDFQKTYDRVRWSFVDIVLQKMGFGHRWRTWVKECVSTTTMSVLVNGLSSKPFNMERGLRQGDPLSPLLFVLVVDILHRMLGEAVRNGRIAPLLVGGDRCNQADLPVWYLGVQLGANPRLVKTWKPIIDKVEEKLSLWKAKVLNKACKLVLIKSVFNSLPIYYLSLYKMPKAVADKLIALQRSFMWCKEDSNYGIPLVKWEVVQAPKKAGGLGVRDAVLRNTTLLFKWWWRFSKEECPLWKKIVCSCNKLNPNVMLANQTLPVLQSETLSDEITSYNFTSSIWRGVVWCAWLKAWDRDWTILGTIKELFESWTTMHNRKETQKTWMTGFFAVIWNVWLERNARIFNNKETSVDIIKRRMFLSYKEWIDSDPFGC